jgi:sugar lactone lactonase YvrE
MGTGPTLDSIIELMKKSMRSIVLILLFLLIANHTYCQNIVTVAGIGIAGHTGDNGPATAAEIYDPILGTFDAEGNYYFVQPPRHIVSKIDTHGTITTIAGIISPGYNGDEIPATSAKLNYPTSVIVDTSGNIFICDHDNNRIRRIDKITKQITTVAGTGVAGFGGDGNPATSAILKGPDDICFDKHGNLFIADVNNYRVRIINVSGIISTYAGNGSVGYSGDNGPSTAAQIIPSGVCADDTGNIYIADATMGEQRIAKVNAVTKIITTIAGTDTGYLYNGDGIPATSANINPARITWGKDYHSIYITDVLNNRVRRIDSVGTIHNVAGNGIQGFGGDGYSALAAELYYPSGMCFDKCGNLYFGDSFNNRVRKVTFDTSCNIATLTISSAETTKLNCYPNPASTHIAIRYPGDGKYVVSIINPLGQTLLTQPFEKKNEIINIEWLSPGIYVLKITGAENETVITKFIKQ